VRGSVPISFAVTCVSAATWSSAPFCAQFPELQLSLCSNYRALDPRPRPSSRSTLFTRSADGRFSGSGCRPTTSATYFRRTDTLPSIRFPRFTRPAFRSDAECAPVFSCMFRARDLPLSKKGHESCEPRQSFRDRPGGAASAPQSEGPKTILRSERRLRATLRSDHRLRRWPLDESAGLHGSSKP